MSLSGVKTYMKVDRVMSALVGGSFWTNFGSVVSALSLFDQSSLRQVRSFTGMNLIIGMDYRNGVYTSICGFEFL